MSPHYYLHCPVHCTIGATIRRCTYRIAVFCSVIFHHTLCCIVLYCIVLCCVSSRLPTLLYFAPLLSVPLYCTLLCSTVLLLLRASVCQCHHAQYREQNRTSCRTYTRIISTNINTRQTPLLSSTLTTIFPSLLIPLTVCTEYSYYYSLILILILLRGGL